MTEENGQVQDGAEDHALLEQLARAHNVSTTFQGWDGAERQVSSATLRRVLTALGMAADSRTGLEQALAASRLAPWRRFLPPVVVGREGREQDVQLHVPAGSHPRVWMTEENGAVRELAVDNGTAGTAGKSEVVDGQKIERRSVRLPADLPLGWHTLHVEAAGSGAQCQVIVTPPRLATTDRLQGARWGVMAQLYSVRSSQSWGIGDFADLAELAKVSAGRGADFLLVNPLHAAEPVPPVEPSPYLPTTRRFFNPLYIRIEDIPELADLDAADRDRVAKLSDGFAAANRAADVLDRNSTYAAKLEALESLHRAGLDSARGQEFEAYCEAQGQGLADFALWCALAEQDGRGDSAAALENGPGSAEAQEQRQALAGRIRFYSWLQWICDQQLQAAQRSATESGMDLGIIHDLAVGVHTRGADAWTLQDVLASGVTVGAPPDMFNQRGQNWTQPPWHPERLASAGYAPYRDMLRNILRHAGGIRVDHILGLFRLWWIPEGAEPGEGAYVYYDHEALIGILALEAQRAGAVVIGEDLGVFEPWVRDYLGERGILGTSILWFEHGENGPIPPEEYRRDCLTSVNTHDLPPTAGYLAGDHVTLRESLGLLNRPAAEERAADAAAQEEVLKLVRRRGLLTAGETGVQETVEALHRYISLTPSSLLGVALVDAVGERRTQNQPGTLDEYPNWRVPLAGPDGEVLLLDDLASNRRFASLAELLPGRDADGRS